MLSQSEAHPETADEITGGGGVGKEDPELVGAKPRAAGSPTLPPHREKLAKE